MATTNRKEALSILKDIIKCEVKLEDAKENVEILFEVLPALISQMKAISPLFSQIYKTPVYTGSYFENLRVKNATEFDLNIILDFCLESTDFEILTNCSPASFSKFHLKSSMGTLSTRRQWQSIRNIINKFFDGDNYLIPDNVRRWFEGIVDSARERLPTIRNVSEIRRAVSGPAVTLNITTTTKVKLDVDLVPVIEFKRPNWPNNANQLSNKLNVPEKDRYFFMVLKPVPVELAVQSERVERLWRLHFPGIEHHLLYNKGCIKSVIRLMKLLRDRQDWKILASYCLKTVVMWSVIKDNLDWNESYMDINFLAMLKKLAGYVRQRNLPYIVYPSFNLLYKLDTDSSRALGHSENLYFSIMRIIKKIEERPKAYNMLMRK